MFERRRHGLDGIDGIHQHRGVRGDQLGWIRLFEMGHEEHVRDRGEGRELLATIVAIDDLSYEIHGCFLQLTAANPDRITRRFGFAATGLGQDDLQVFRLLIAVTIFRSARPSTIDIFE